MSSAELSRWSPPGTSYLMVSASRVPEPPVLVDPTLVCGFLPDHGEVTLLRRDAQFGCTSKTWRIAGEPPTWAHAGWVGSSEFLSVPGEGELSMKVDRRLRRLGL